MQQQGTTETKIRELFSLINEPLLKPHGHCDKFWRQILHDMI